MPMRFAGNSATTKGNEMPIRFSPRPIRAIRNSMTVFYAEMAAKGIVSVAFFLSLGIVPTP